MTPKAREALQRNDYLSPNSGIQLLLGLQDWKVLPQSVTAAAPRGPGTAPQRRRTGRGL